ncbi:MAG TPA: HAMP domain-containing sensor histidine kinase [Elusimicrobiales bacterium]|nr:HAMP domain-containing sensor histidine kinase [Elusimicrobiales bacterium]HOL62870.1 HAMP domain-containing sensor histidine kinase [Elusimicrobiales bacterium]
MVETYKKIFKNSWKYYLISIIVFMLFWQILSLINMINSSRDKLHTAMRQNAAYFEKAYLTGDIFEVQRIMWRMKNEGIKRISFNPDKTENINWVFNKAVVGNIYDRKYFQKEYEENFVSNGAKIGNLYYVIDFIDINSSVWERNKILFVAVMLFFASIVIYSNMGLIKTTLMMEKITKKINILARQRKSEEMKKIIAEIPANVKGFEVEELIKDMNLITEKVSKVETELEVSKALSEVAERVAHDIRSPIAAIENVIDFKKLTKEEQDIIKPAICRMKSIAEDLLSKYRNSKNGYKAENKFKDLNILIGEISAEKKAEHKNIKIEILNQTEKQVFVDLTEKEIKRIISNLINNSVEAYANNIKITLETDDKNAVLKIKDDGKGISKGLLSKLGEKGFSYGKEKGNGLGLWNAKKILAESGGVLDINSEEGFGTEVILKIPIKIRKIVLIDDDILVRKNWEFSAKKKNIELDIYDNTESFIQNMDKYDFDTEIYIDSELGEDNKGEDIARNLYEIGYTNIYIETGHSFEKFKDLKYIKAVISKEPPF